MVFNFKKNFILFLGGKAQQKINAFLRLDREDGKQHQRIKKLSLLCVFLLVFGFYLVAIKAPSDFPENKIFVIREGEALSEISERLEQKKIIRSATLFNFLMKVEGKDRLIFAGDYYFDKALNLFNVGTRIGNGDFGIVLIKVTLPEGLTIFEIGDILERKLTNFNKEEFLNKTKDKEGYLFPDTYFFMPSVDTDEIISVLENNFKRKIEEIRWGINISGRSLSDIVTMASILEKEVSKKEDREIVSGILWKRIEIGMPLQVDATFLYINGRNTYQLTAEDLKIDSPYNTYKNKGLPKGPIANPSMDSILAAINPIKTDYLFYLSDRSGNLYYSKDFEDHKKNKSLYLN